MRQSTQDMELLSVKGVEHGYYGHVQILFKSRIFPFFLVLIERSKKALDFHGEYLEIIESLVG